MKVSLVVRTAGRMQGKAVPVAGTQFLIGRDPQCQLRPATPLVSGRHCAVVVRGDAVSVRDFESTNGTFVNDERVTGERALGDGDRLRLGPLEFDVRLEPSATTATPAGVRQVSADDEAAAALLLALQDDRDSKVPAGAVDEYGVPSGTTLMDMTAPTPEDLPSGPDRSPPQPKKGTPKPPKKATADTSTAATDLLQKYLRRPRNT